jgi:hypothetical protein
VEKGFGDPCGAVDLAEVVPIVEKAIGGDSGVMEAKRQVGLGGMPVFEEVGGALGNESLVRGDGPIGKEEFLQGKKRRGTIEEIACFR